VPKIKFHAGKSQILVINLNIIILRCFVQFEPGATTSMSWEGDHSLTAVWRNGVFIEVTAVTLAEIFIKG
jgi:hypothetical protein